MDINYNLHRIVKHVLKFSCLLLVTVTFSCNNEREGNSGSVDTIQDTLQSKNRFEIKGIYNDISPNADFVLLKEPFPDQDGEYILGELYLYNVKAGVKKIIADTIDINNPNCTFLSDSIILIPTSSSIMSYNIVNKQPSVLTELKGNQFFNGLSVSIQYKTLATIITDFENKTAFLLLYNWETNDRIVVNVEYDFKSTNEYPQPEMYWIENELIYSLHDKLYEYTLNSEKYILITDRLKYNQGKPAFAIDHSNCLFLQNNDPAFKFFSLKNKTVDNLKLNVNNGNISLFTGVINSQFTCFATMNDKNYIIIDSKLEEVKELTAFKNNNVKIGIGKEKFWIEKF